MKRNCGTGRVTPSSPDCCWFSEYLMTIFRHYYSIDKVSFVISTESPTHNKVYEVISPLLTESNFKYLLSNVQFSSSNLLNSAYMQTLTLLYIIKLRFQKSSHTLSQILYALNFEIVFGINWPECSIAHCQYMRGG